MVMGFKDKPTLFPAHAGVIRCYLLLAAKQIAFPRTRGGDPRQAVKIWKNGNFSPHTRG